MKRVTLYCCAAVCVVFAACVSLPDEPERDAPLDTANPEYVPPAVTVTAGPDGDTLDTDRALFEWAGNAYADTFSYRLNGGAWSGWSASSFADLEDLPEGRNIFEVRGRYPNGDVSSRPDSVLFWVDAVRGPALLTVPRTVACTAGETFSVHLYADEVTDLAMAYASVTYDHALLALQSAQEGPLLAQEGGAATVFRKESGDTLAVTAIRSALGHAHGVSGSGVVCTLRFTALGTGTAPVAVLQSASGLRTPAAELPLRAAGVCVVTCR